MTGQQPTKTNARAERVVLQVDGEIFGLRRHGGVHRATENLVDALAERRTIDLRLHVDPDAEVSDRHAAVTLCSPASPRDLRPGRVFAGFNARRRTGALRAYWRAERDGIYLATYYTTHDGLRIPQLSVIHDMIYELFPEYTQAPQQHRHKADRARAIEAADAIVCPSRSALEDLESLFDVTGKRRCVVHWGVDPVYGPVEDAERLRTFTEEATGGRPFALFVGARGGTKNFLGLAAAFARWSGGSELAILTVGGGTFSNEEYALLHAFGMRERVACIPYLSSDALCLAYNAAAFCVMPSLYEGFGFPVAESLACGTPTAASDVSSLPEVGGSQAVLFDPASQDAIIDALERVAAQERGGDAAQARIGHASQFSWARCAEAYERFARELV